MNRVVFRSPFAIVVATALLACAGMARAQECAITCNTQARACMQEARTGMRSCAGGCRTAETRLAAMACFKDCVGSFSTRRSACRSTQMTCVRGCPAEPGSESGGGCRSSCAMALAMCARQVATQSRRCTHECVTAPDRDACQAVCTTASQSGSEKCRGTFAACSKRCNGSPAGALLPEHPASAPEHPAAS